MDDTLTWLQTNVWLDQPALWKRIYIFNWLLPEYVHASHLESWINPEIAQACAEDPKSYSLLCKGLLSHIGLLSAFDFDFQEPKKRLAFIEGSILEVLLLHVGAALLSQRIGQVIGKRDRLELEKKISPQVYAFALRRAPFLKELFPALELPATKDLAGDIELTACRVLGAVFSNENDAFKRRFALCFSNRYTFDFSKKISPELSQKCWNFIHRILVKEVAPSVGAIFKAQEKIISEPLVAPEVASENPGEENTLPS
jgi:hypothetical protein